MKSKLIILLLAVATSPAIAQLYIVAKPQYRAVYDTHMNCPQQVLWTIHASDLGHVRREPSWRFTADLPRSLSLASHSDYNKSGYDRGHMCPALDRSARRDDMRKTFCMSNIAPQEPKVNTGSWKRTENICRAAALTYDSVCVVAMPVFLDRDTAFIGKHRLAVPHAFFKACWVSGTDSVLYSWFIFNK